MPPLPGKRADAGTIGVAHDATPAAGMATVLSGPAPHPGAGWPFPDPGATGYPPYAGNRESMATE